MAQTDISGIAQAAASIANAQNSFSDSTSNSFGVGGSANNSWQVSDSLADSWGFGNEASAGEGWTHSYSEESGEGRTFGREASAQDIENAREANMLQRDLWAEQAAYNAKQAEIDRAYQERMSNTSYQRAVKDLIAAGLNPILAAGNLGATTPVGAMASSGLASSHKANAYAESYNKNSGSSASHGYNYNTSAGHSESGSHSQSHSEGQSQGSSWNTEGSSSESHSETTTQLAQLANIISDLTNANGNSGKNKTPTPYTGKKPPGGVTKSPRQLEEQIANERRRK